MLNPGQGRMGHKAYAPDFKQFQAGMESSLGAPSEQNQAFLHGHSAKATEAQLKQMLNKLERVSERLELRAESTRGLQNGDIVQAIQSSLNQRLDASEANTPMQIEKVLAAQFELHMANVTRLLGRLLEEQSKRQDAKLERMFERHEKRLERMFEQHSGAGK